jgi:hypothetical protein
MKKEKKSIQIVCEKKKNSSFQNVAVYIKNKVIFKEQICTKWDRK